MMHRDRLRASAVADWAACPRWARHRPPTPARSIAAVVGTLTHAYLAGESNVDLPSDIRYDRDAPTLADAMRQARMMAKAVQRLYGREGIEIDRHEVALENADMRLTGHVDGVGRHGDLTLALDVKTGYLVQQAWLQLGAYAVLLAAAGTPVDEVAVVHMPRAPLARLGEARIEYRRADAVSTQFRRWLQALDHLHAGNLADMATPGPHCRWCKLDCAVRSSVDDRR